MLDINNISLSSETLPTVMALADMMPGGFFIYRADSSEEFLLVNSAMHSILGCGSDGEFRAYTGNSFKGLVYPADLEGVEESILRQIAKNSSKMDYVEYRVLSVDGKIKWLRDYGHYIDTEQYGPVFVVFVSDVTAEHSDIMLEHTLYGEALYALSSQFNSVYYVDLESDRFILYKNEGTFSAAGSKLASQGSVYSQAILAAINNIVLPEDRDRMLIATAPESLRRSLAVEDTLNYRYRVMENAMGQVWFNAKIVRCAPEKPGIRFVMGFECIDRLVREEEEHEQSLRAANNAKTSFLFNMSHDIRTPLNAVLGYAKLIGQNIDNREKILDYRAKIERSGDYLLSIINNVLEMAQIESGTIRLDSTYVYVGGIVANTVDIYNAILTEKNLTLNHVVKVEHPHILGDPTKLREIYDNLLSNAIKYTPAGGTITINTEELPSPDSGTVIIRTSVRDTGIGMSPEFIPRIFDNFSRERNTTAGRVAGTGLGMPIVKKLVERKGGTIEIESEPGRGSCFTVTLAHRIADEASMPHRRVSEDRIDADALRGIRILIAEDNELNAEITRTILKEEFGIETDRAEDGSVCLDMLLSAPEDTYSLILMDVQMPRMSGYEATKAIRSLSDPVRSRIPILAMTANVFEEDRHQARLAGMDGHVSKPIDSTQLLREIASVLEN